MTDTTQPTHSHRCCSTDSIRGILNSIELPRRQLQVIVDDNRIRDNNWLPSRAHASAGIDLRAMFTQSTPGLCVDSNGDECLLIPPGTAILVPTGLRVWIRDPSYVGLLFPRSSTGHKRGLVLGNGTGVIDADYQGPLMVSLLNRTTDLITVELGERIAQLVIVPIDRPGITVVDTFEEGTERGTGGFGSTGHK